MVKVSELEGRLDPNRYHPKIITAIQRIKKGYFKYKLLKSIVSFSNIIVKLIPRNSTYIGMENIETNTGIYIYRK